MDGGVVWGSSSAGSTCRSHAVQGSLVQDQLRDVSWLERAEGEQMWLAQGISMFDEPIKHAFGKQPFAYSVLG